jgi:hypothetical protein
MRRAKPMRTPGRCDAAPFNPAPSPASPHAVACAPAKSAAWGRWTAQGGSSGRIPRRAIPGSMQWQPGKAITCAYRPRGHCSLIQTDRRRQGGDFRGRLKQPAIKNTAGAAGIRRNRAAQGKIVGIGPWDRLPACRPDQALPSPGCRREGGPQALIRTHSWMMRRRRMLNLHAGGTRAGYADCAL